MSLLTLFAIYFTTWWIVLFAVLPFGVRKAQTIIPGQDSGAPDKPNLLRLFLINSAITGVIVLGVWAVFATGLLDWRAITQPS